MWIPLKQRMQQELLKRGHCVGCSRPLGDAERSPSKQNDQFSLVTCSCRRIYLYNKQLNNYRRALISDLEYHL